MNSAGPAGGTAGAENEHRMSRSAAPVTCAVLALVLLGGCGQKGPLFLPDKKASVVKPTAAPDASRPPEKIDPEQKDDSQKPPTP